VWLRCEIDDDANGVLIVLARQDMLATAVRRGVGQPIYIWTQRMGSRGMA
jgi:hypothetical protein